MRTVNGAKGTADTASPPHFSISLPTASFSTASLSTASLATASHPALSTDFGGGYLETSIDAPPSKLRRGFDAKQHPRPTTYEPFFREYEAGYRQFAHPDQIGPLAAYYALGLMELAPFRRMFSHYQMGAGFTDTWKEANHNRGTHTMHAAAVAVEMAKHARLDAWDSTVLIMSVLLHDVGHTFGSHQLEDTFNTFKEYSKASGKTPYCHELRTRGLIESDEFRRVLGDRLVNAVVGVLYEKCKNEPLATLADWADRFGYLKQDLAHSDHPYKYQIEPDIKEAISKVTIRNGRVVWTDSEALERIIDVKFELYAKVSKGYAASLFDAFLTEAVERALKHHGGMPIQRFQAMIQDLPSRQAVNLFCPEDRGRLVSPFQDPRRPDPIQARPIDNDYVPVVDIDYSMLTLFGRGLVYENSDVLGMKNTASMYKVAQLCERKRVGMTKLECQVRRVIAEAFDGDHHMGKFAKDNGILVFLVECPIKEYELNVADGSPRGYRDGVPKKGGHNLRLCVAVPDSMPEKMKKEIHRAVMQGLARGQDRILESPAKIANPRVARDVEFAMEHPPSPELFKQRF